MADSTMQHIEATPRSRRPWGPVIIVVAALGFYYVTTLPSRPLDGWQVDYASALTQAAGTDRKLVVAFHTDGCPPCRTMEQQVLTSPLVRKALDAFIAVRVDASRERELANLFDIAGTPTYTIVDKSGRVLARCEGFQPVEAFVEFLKSASHLRSAAVPRMGLSRRGDP